MVLSGNRELEWSLAGRPLPGETMSGDSHLVAETSRGWLLAVVDGLGHGPKAAAASSALIETLAHHVDLELVELVRHCHEVLKKTRGSACAIASIDSHRGLLNWLGIGNVEGVVRHEDGKTPNTEYITMRSGIIGYRLPRLQPSFLHLSSGDTLIMATDGVNGDFVELLCPGQSPDLLAAAILDRYAKPTDDALVLVARWRSPSGLQGGSES